MTVKSLRGLCHLIVTMGAAIAITAFVMPASVATLPTSVAAKSYIVTARSLGDARRVIDSVGGEVTHELPIIDAVAASLTSHQRNQVAGNGTVLSVFENAPVSLASLVSTVGDDFNRVSWTNQDGTHRWSAPWLEAGDDGQALTGKAAISLGLLASGKLALTGSGVRLARKASLPPGATHAILRFDSQRLSLESNDFVSIQASRDGGFTWAEVGRLAGPANDAVALRTSVDMSAFISADTVVRLVTTFHSSLLNSDAVYIDNLELSYDSVYADGVSYPSLAGASQLHAEALTGALVTVAVLDSGYWKHPAVEVNALGLQRVLAQYDAVAGSVDSTMLSLLGITSLGSTVDTDGSGHGAHVTGVILNTERTADGRYFGVAPNANLVSVRAFDAQGHGTYASVIRGIDWVVRNKNIYRIRVLNLSLGAAPQSHYWEDPLNRAVMRAWQAGIVVVASAGNTGPGPQSITVPGNVPYVITVGAMTDSYTPENPGDDRLTSFSAVGPTYEGFVKPDLVAPGGHIWSLMPTSAAIAQAHPAYQNDGDYFTMSGTSQSAAVVSGAVALMLQAEPWLTPDDVKCKLIASARPAVTPDQQLAYSVFQQGSGLVSAYDARHEAQRGCANIGLDIDKDLADVEHYGGPARQSETGEYYIAGSNGYAWNQGYAWRQGYAWNQGYAWHQGYAWRQGYAWNQSAYEWQEGEPWAEGNRPDAAASMSINAWVEQE